VLDFALATELEASVPPERRGLARDGVRMLVTPRSGGASADAHFRDLARTLRRGDLIIVNDSLAAAATATRSDESSLLIHFSTRIAERLWIVEPRGRVVPGEAVTLQPCGKLRFLAPLDEAVPRLWYAAVDANGGVAAWLDRFGSPIRYRYVAEEYPLADYQTIFAREAGSAEMPSASRPFTPRIVRELDAAGVGIASVTLHAGVSSLERQERPIAERYVVSSSTAATVNATRRAGRRIVAAGTTVVRALETAASDAAVTASNGWTELIVTAEHRLRAVDALLTGFHEPQASHLDMLAAFLAPQALREAYAHALNAGYLWHEFGDVNLIV